MARRGSSEQIDSRGRGQTRNVDRIINLFTELSSRSRPAMCHTFFPGLQRSAFLSANVFIIFCLVEDRSADRSLNVAHSTERVSLIRCSGNEASTTLIVPGQLKTILCRGGNLDHL